MASLAVNTDLATLDSGGDGAYTDPYRLYNLDVFEYDADSEMAIVSRFDGSHLQHQR